MALSVLVWIAMQLFLQILQEDYIAASCWRKKNSTKTGWHNEFLAQSLIHQNHYSSAVN